MIEFVDFSVKAGNDIILHPLNLQMQHPFSYGIIGHSGSGKSTLAKALCMLLSSKLIQSGAIYYKNKNILDLKKKEQRLLRKHELKYLVQEPYYALTPHLKIKTQLKELYDHAPSDEILLSELESVNLNDKKILQSYPHELSGGQRQRISLLQGLICEPKVLIADEPTTALDPLVEKQILELIQQYLKTHQGSLLLISHDLRSIVKMTDVTLVFHQGRLVETLLSKDLLQNAKHPYTISLIESLIYKDFPLRPPVLPGVINEYSSL